MFCAKCGKPIGENMRFCAGCGTPVAPSSTPNTPPQQQSKEYSQLSGPNPAANPPQAAFTQAPPMPVRQQPPMTMQQPPAAAPQPAKKKKKKKNLALKIIAIILVIAVLLCGGYLGINGFKNSDETKADGVIYIDDFPVLKGETDFQVYDAEKFPVDEYDIKIEKFLFGGALRGVSSKSEILNEKSSNPIYKLKLEDGDYRITLEGVVSSRTQATTTEATTAAQSSTAEPTVIIIIIDIVVDNDNPDAVDKVDLSWSDKQSATPDSLPADAKQLLGRVYQASDNTTGISGATIKIFDTNNTQVSTVDTDSTGGYAVSLPAGKYNAVVTIAGFKEYKFDFEITNDADTSVDIYLESVPTGTLSGKVCKATDRVTPISGATISVIQNGETVLTAKSDSSGSYSIKLPEGQFTVKISNAGYIDFNSYADVTVNETTYMETFLLIDGSATENGTATGTIFNSLTKEGVSGVTLTVKKDWNNADGTGSTIKTVTTDSNGNYKLDLPLGNYTVIATKDGFTSSNFNIIVQRTATDNQNGMITPVISGNDYLITLTWNQNPEDLDAHLYNYENGYENHIYYEALYLYDDNYDIIGELDYDDMESYGPEHITFTAVSDEPYYFFVHHYSGSGSLSSSGAKVTIEQGNRLIAEYNVPSNGSNNYFWNVFAIKDGQIITENTLTSEPDVYYAD